jgi:hypothetical protein
MTERFDVVVELEVLVDQVQLHPQKSAHGNAEFLNEKIF